MSDRDIYEAFADGSVTPAEIAAVSDEVIERQVAELIDECDYDNFEMTVKEIAEAIRRYVGKA